MATKNSDVADSGSKRHALVTGPITGLVDTPDPGIPHDRVDVTPAVLYFDELEHAQIVAAAIEEQHYANGTHPTQLADAAAAATPKDDA